MTTKQDIKHYQLKTIGVSNEDCCACKYSFLSDLYDEIICDLHNELYEKILEEEGKRIALFPESGCDKKCPYYSIN